MRIASGRPRLVDGSTRLVRYNELKEYTNSEEFKERKIYLLDKKRFEKTEMFKRHFRHCASRSLMILRNYKGRTKSVGKQQLSSGFLLAAARKTSNAAAREAARAAGERECRW
jgi:ATP-dependent Lhr-like helicase